MAPDVLLLTGTDMPVPARFLATLREIAAATTLVNDVELVAWNHHKRYLAELVPVVPLAVLERGSDTRACDDARTAFGAQIVVKPAISAGAFGTIRTAAALREAREHLASLVAEGDAIVQPYLREVSLVYFGGALSHAVRKPGRRTGADRFADVLVGLLDGCRRGAGG